MHIFNFIEPYKSIKQKNFNKKPDTILHKIFLNIPHTIDYIL